MSLSPSIPGSPKCRPAARPSNDCSPPRPACRHPRWLRHARILHAIPRLAAGDKVSSVAFDMGYASSSAFSYMFRRALGRSPRELLYLSPAHGRPPSFKAWTVAGRHPQ